MGWTTIPGIDKRALIRERTERQESESTIHECLAHSIRGTILWTVWEVTTKATGERHRFIGCDILYRDKEYDGWGYKDLCESMGPYYYTCPLKYLDLVPEVADASWREEVRAHHEKARRRRALIRGLKIGDTIRLREGCSPQALTVTSLKPLLGSSDGMLYRVMPRHIASPEEG